MKLMYLIKRASAVKPRPISIRTPFWLYPLLQVPTSHHTFISFLYTSQHLIIITANLSLLIILIGFSVIKKKNLIKIPFGIIWYVDVPHCSFLRSSFHKDNSKNIFLHLNYNLTMIFLTLNQCLNVYILQSYFSYIVIYI